MLFPLNHALSFFCFHFKRVEEISFRYRETFEIFGAQFCSNKLNNSSVKIGTVLSKEGNFFHPLKFHQILIENGKGAMQSPMSLQTASQVTRDYGNRYLMSNFRCKHMTITIG